MQLRFLGTEPHDVPVLGRVVSTDELVNVPDDIYKAHGWAESLWAVVKSSKSTTKSEG